MTLLSDLCKWFKSPGRTTPSKGHPDLNPYDVAKLVGELNLVSEARRLGAAGVPPPDAVGPGGVEATAIQRVDKVRQDYVEWAGTRLAVINESLTKADVTQSVNRARQADKEFERQASSLLTEREADLRSTGDRARQTDAELSAFKQLHGLTREAVFPSGMRSFLGYALLFFLVVVEGVLNATFFAQGLDSGLFGGGAYAMTLAAVNVSIAYVLGRWPSRNIHHSKAVMKLFGWLFVLVALSAMVTVGLGIAHFRDALTSGSLNAPADALRSLKESPLALKDLMSWGLFAVSIVFAAAAFFDGMFSDDLYPGYGKVARRAQEAAADHEEELRGVRSALDELRRTELELLDKAAREAQGSVARVATLIGDKRATQLRLEQSLLDAANSLNAVLLKFREENQVARGGLPRPAYFDEPPKLTTLTLPNFTTDQDEKSLSVQQQLADTLVAELQETRARIQAAFNEKFDLLKPLRIHFATEGVQA